jgi:hypothetical protein
MALVGGIEILNSGTKNNQIPTASDQPQPNGQKSPLNGMRSHLIASCPAKQVETGNLGSVISAATS